MKSNLLPLGLLTLLLSSSLSGASAQPGPAAAAKKADEEWLALKDLGQPKSQSPGGPVSPAAAAQARQQFAVGLVRDADRLKEFRTTNPAHAGAKKAKRLEALLLVQAWRAGASSSASRRTQLVAEIRGDASLPAASRAEVAALAEHVAVAKRPGLSRDGRLAAYEQAVRGLTAEFPELPNGYESLVQIAKDSSDAKAQAIARNVLGLAAAPATVKAEAQILLDRHALVGRPVAELVRPILGAANPIERAKGRPLVLYSWATFAAGSHALAADLAARTPAGVALVGLCLDFRDLAPAKALATAQKLPGEQLYDWLGRRGEVAERLKLTDPALAFVIDAGGIIRAVSAQRDLPATLAALAATKP